MNKNRQVDQLAVILSSLAMVLLTMIQLRAILAVTLLLKFHKRSSRDTNHCLRVLMNFPILLTSALQRSTIRRRAGTRVILLHIPSLIGRTLHLIKSKAGIRPRLKFIRPLLHILILVKQNSARNSSTTTILRVVSLTRMTFRLSA